MGKNFLENLWQVLCVEASVRMAHWHLPEREINTKQMGASYFLGVTQAIMFWVTHLLIASASASPAIKIA